MIRVCSGHTFGQILENRDVKKTRFPGSVEIWLAVGYGHPRGISNQTWFDSEAEHHAAETGLLPSLGNADPFGVRCENGKLRHGHFLLSNDDLQVNGSLQRLPHLSDNFGSHPFDSLGRDDIAGILLEGLPKICYRLVLWILLWKPNGNLKNHSAVLLGSHDHRSPKNEITDESSF
jgi:hypothetical protein